MENPVYLGHDEVLENLPFDVLFNKLEDGFISYTNKTIYQPNRMVLNVNAANIFLIKPVISIPDNSIATKLVSVFPENEAKYDKPNLSSVVVLLDSTTGVLKGVMDGTSITDRRTAVATAVAVKYLSKHHDGILAVIGTGHQGKSHVEAFKALFNFKQIRVFSRNEERREKFAKEMNVKSADSVEEAVKDADVIVTATMSTTPVVLNKWVKKGALVNIVGAPFLNMREVDDEIMLSSQVFADSVEESYKNAGDVVSSNAKIDFELGDVIQGKSQINWQQTRVFKSNGLAIQDLIAAKIVLENKSLNLKH